MDDEWPRRRNTEKRDELAPFHRLAPTLRIAELIIAGQGRAPQQKRPASVRLGQPVFPFLVDQLGGGGG